jgi:hypothetical protein
MTAFKPTLLQEIMQTLHFSMNDIAERIDDVRYGNVEDNSIFISLDGKTLKGYFRGRNQNLILTGDKKTDKRIAVRVLLDDDFERE